MQLPLPRDRRRRAVSAASVVVVCGLAAIAWLYLRSIDAERERAGGLDRVVVESETLVPPNGKGVTLWLAADAPEDVEPFRGDVYAATPAGLAVYDENGNLKRRYTTLDGLPENSLTCLERYGDLLYVGTASSGLLSFDGTKFTRYRFVHPASDHVSALCASDAGLLVGTFDAGVFEFDGQSFTRRFQHDAGDACRRVTSLVALGPRVYVGTHDAGLFEWKEGSVANLREKDGLPSDRVTGMAARVGTLFVSTDLGVVTLGSDDKPATVDRTPNATAVAVRNDDVWVSSLTRGVSGVGDAPLGPDVTPVADRGAEVRSGFAASLPTSSVRRVKTEDGVLWAVTDVGLFACLTQSGPARFEQFGDPEARKSGLSAGHVAALALDSRGRLWAGLFDGGIDILDPASGARLDHVDDPALHEINAIVSDPSNDRMWVATSKGLAVFDAGKRTRLMGEREGLVGENVAGVATNAGTGGGLALATNRGVTIVDGGTARSVTAFHGLPSNHAYSVAVVGGRTYVGTLGGLAELDGLRVARTFTTAGSRLPHNWVNALAALEGRLYIGTYGGGVAVLTPAGELLPAEETKGLEVNPGAMLAVDGRLYVGTLKSGVFALDGGTGKWTRIAAVLTSANATAFATDDSYLYVGTEHGITRIERSSLS